MSKVYKVGDKVVYTTWKRRQLGKVVQAFSSDTYSVRWDDNTTECVCRAYLRRERGNVGNK